VCECAGRWCERGLGADGSVGRRYSGRGRGNEWRKGVKEWVNNEGNEER
jgi:hypothetical protein